MKTDSRIDSTFQNIILEILNQIGAALVSFFSSIQHLPFSCSQKSYFFSFRMSKGQAEEGKVQKVRRTRRSSILSLRL